jgi:hypothetical protein
VSRLDTDLSITRKKRHFMFTPGAIASDPLHIHYMHEHFPTFHNSSDSLYGVLACLHKLLNDIIYSCSLAKHVQPFFLWILVKHTVIPLLAEYTCQPASSCTRMIVDRLQKEQFNL